MSRKFWEVITCDFRFVGGHRMWYWKQSFEDFTVWNLIFCELYSKVLIQVAEFYVMCFSSWAKIAQNCKTIGKKEGKQFCKIFIEKVRSTTFLIISKKFLYWMSCPKTFSWFRLYWRRSSTTTGASGQCGPITRTNYCFTSPSPRVKTALGSSRVTNQLSHFLHQTTSTAHSDEKET